MTAKDHLKAYRPKSLGGATMNAAQITPAVIDGCNILFQVAAERGMTLKDLVGPSRAQPIAHARQYAMMMMKDLTSLSFPQIAELCGRKDHTTAMYGVIVARSRAANGVMK